MTWSGPTSNKTKNEIPWNKFKAFCFNFFRKFDRTFWVFSFIVTRAFFQFRKIFHYFFLPLITSIISKHLLFFLFLKRYILPYQNILGTLWHHICHTCTPLTYENILYTFSLKNKKEEQTHFFHFKIDTCVSFITYKQLKFVKVILFFRFKCKVYLLCRPGSWKLDSGPFLQGKVSPTLYLKIDHIFLPY